MSVPAETVLVVIGAGPRGAGVLERMVANSGLLREGTRIRIHLVDPHPPGAGRIWRRAQSDLLKLNSMAEDVTMYTDESSVLAGPIQPGPSLIEWAEGVRTGHIDDVDLDEPHLREQLDELTATSFPTRQLQSAYLDWFFRRTVAQLPDELTLELHRSRAISVDDQNDGSQVVHLENGDDLRADLILYAVGHTGSAPDETSARLSRFAERHDLLYFPPTFTADADTSGILPGEDVIVRGMGLASVDLVVLLTEGRGGRFETGTDGVRRYRPSGAEPRLYLGSRRGVPYHSKISSQLRVPRIPARFFTAEIARDLEKSLDRLRFREDIWPLIAKELLWGYYAELFRGHPDRVRASWEDFGEEFARLDWDSPKLAALVNDTVIDPLDRLGLLSLDRPLAGLKSATSGDLQETIRQYIRTDLRLRSAPEHSATLALFYSLLFSMFDLGTIIDSPKWSAKSRIDDLPVWWLNYFSYIASGPPAHRLEELLLLSEAGIVEFLGPDIWVRTDDAGHFAAGSPSVERQVTARVLVDARIPRSTIGTSDEPILRTLVESGAGSEEYLEDDEARGSTGKLEVRREDSRILDSVGNPHARRFAVGAYTNAPFVGAFSRPRTNAVSFRENDRVARAILTLAVELSRDEQIAETQPTRGADAR